MTEPRCLVLFESVHETLRAEKILRQRGVWCDLVPTPQQYSTDCGMSLEILAVDAAVLDDLRDSLVLNFCGMHALN